MREIGDAVGLSSLSSVTHQLNQLELSGYLRRDPNRPRALEVLIELPGRRAETVDVDDPTPVGDAAMVPLVGRIAAGIPITAEQQVDEVFPLPRQLVGKGDLFMLKVVGESMIDAAICDGDWVVVRQQQHGRERRDRRGDARRRGDRQGVPPARRPHLAAPAQLGVRADPGRPRRGARQGRRGAALGLTPRSSCGERARQRHAARTASALRRREPAQPSSTASMNPACSSRKTVCPVPGTVSTVIPCLRSCAATDPVMSRLFSASTTRLGATRRHGRHERPRVGEAEDRALVPVAQGRELDVDVGGVPLRVHPHERRAGRPRREAKNSLNSAPRMPLGNAKAGSM